MRQSEISDAEHIAQWAKDGAAHGDCGRMCNDCAFKKGTDANNDPYVASAALECVVYEMGKFVCHHEDNGKFIRLDIPCAGFKYAQQYWAKRFVGMGEDDRDVGARPVGSIPADHAADKRIAI